MRSLPFLQTFKRFLIATNSAVLSLTITKDKKFILCGCNDGEISVLTEPLLKKPWCTNVFGNRYLYNNCLLFHFFSIDSSFWISVFMSLYILYSFSTGAISRWKRIFRWWRLENSFWKLFSLSRNSDRTRFNSSIRFTISAYDMYELLVDATIRQKAYQSGLELLIRGAMVPEQAVEEPYRCIV